MLDSHLDDFTNVIVGNRDYVAANAVDGALNYK